VGEGASFDFQK